MKKFLFAIFVFAFVSICFVYSNDIRIGVIGGINICTNLIIPSLFVFLVFSTFIISTNISSIIFTPIRWIFKAIFRVDNKLADVIILSFLGGYPVGAKLIANLVEKKQLVATDAKSISFFCVNAGPAFIISGIASAIFSNSKIGIVLLLSQIFSALFIGYFFRRNNAFVKCDGDNSFCVDYLNEFIFSVSSSVNAILKMCGFIVFFSGLIQIIKTNFILPFTNTTQALFFGLIEISYGCKSLIGQNGIFAIVVACIITCFGGLCVNFQVFQILKNCKMDIKKYYFYKLVQCSLSAIITFCCFYFSKSEAEVFSSSSVVVPVFSQKTNDFAILFLILCIVFLSSLKFSVKIENSEGGKL